MRASVTLVVIRKAFEPLTNAFTDFADDMATETAKFVTHTFGAEAANTLYGEGTATAGQEGASATFNGVSTEAAQTPLANAAGAVFATVMMIYTIYTIAKLIIRIVWACEEEELTLNVKRELKSAVYIGSYCASEFLGMCIEKREAYCTFNSPLSRILQEQIRQQLGTNFGSAENPECEGFTLEELQEVDWDKVNPDEWLGIAMANGLNMDPTTASMNKLTGSGSTLSSDDDPRLDAVVRNEMRMDESNPDDVRVALTEAMAGNTDHQTGTNPRVDEIRSRLVEIDQELYALNQQIASLEQVLFPKQGELAKLKEDLAYIQSMKKFYEDEQVRVDNELLDAQTKATEAYNKWLNYYNRYWYGQYEYYTALVNSLTAEKETIEYEIVYWTNQEIEKIAEIAVIEAEIQKIEAQLADLQTDKALLEAEKRRLEAELMKYTG